MPVDSLTDASTTSGAPSTGPGAVPGSPGSMGSPGSPGSDPGSPDRTKVARTGAERFGRLAVVVAPMLAMLGVGLWGLNRGSMWQDEEATFDAAHRSLPELWEMVHHVDVVHAFYYLLMHVWMLPGGGEVWMRVPSLLAAVGSAGLIAALGARLATPRAGLLAGLVFAASPFVSEYAQEGRSFALVALMVLTATWCLVRALEQERTGERSGAGRWWVGYAAASVIALWLHEFAVLALAAHAVTVLIARPGWRAFIRWTVCAVIAAVLVSPLVWVSSHQAGQVSWLARTSIATVTDLAGTLFGPALPGLVVGVVLAAAGVTVTRRPQRPFRLAVLALPLLLVPSAVLLAVSAVKPLFVDRYVFYSVAAAALLVGAGLDRLVGLLPRRWLADLVALVLVVALALAQLPGQEHVRSVSSRDNDLAAAARAVAAGARPGDGVIFMPSKYRAAALAYPDAFRGLDDLALDQSPTQADNLRGRDKSRRQVAKAMRTFDRIWVVGRTGLRVRANEPGAINERNVLRADFTKVSATSMHGMQVALYERKGS